MSGARTSWSTPDDIAASIRRLWDSGVMLAARLDGDALFPHELRLRQPAAAAMGEQFEAVRHWIASLVGASRHERGYGYELVWRDINHRQLGRNSIPVAALIPSDTDALRLIGRAGEARRFDQLAAMTLDAFPTLRQWLCRQPLKLLEHGDAWPRILAVLRWFAAHPRPDIYLRQLDIEGVDTKFIEARKALFAELLDQVMPAEAILASAARARQFETRYGLLSKPPLIRFRMLDAAHTMGGLSDLTVPVEQFAAMQTHVERVFVTENEVNALAFPQVAASMVVFGGGYGIERLAQVEWLRVKDVLYWGDIDTHGFAILDRLRTSMPHTRSLMMDRATLQAHRSLWGSEDADSRYDGELCHLTPEEAQLFQELRENHHGRHLRLEQERIAYHWVVEAIQRA
jgi:hypothetical protein